MEKYALSQTNNTFLIADATAFNFSFSAVIKMGFYLKSCDVQMPAFFAWVKSAEEHLKTFTFRCTRSKNVPATSTMSPGTMSLALILCTVFLSWRYTLPISGSYSLSASMASSALRSWRGRKWVYISDLHWNELIVITNTKTCILLTLLGYSVRDVYPMRTFRWKYGNINHIIFSFSLSRSVPKCNPSPASSSFISEKKNTSVKAHCPHIFKRKKKTHQK